MGKSAEQVTLEDLPVIDKTEGLRLAGQNQALADDIMDLFIKDLTTEVVAINQLFSSQNYGELKTRLHKLHGACCYTGTPRLKSCLYHTETLLKTNQLDTLADALLAVTHEAQQVLIAFQSTKR